MRRLYSCLISCAAPFALAVVLWRGLRDRSYWQDLGQRFGWGAVSPAPSLWVHAVSLGEMSAAAPLIHSIHARYPQIPLVLTTATPAGRSRAQALFGEYADIRFLPYDTPGSVRRFLSRIKPRLAIIMETELWPNLFAQCRQRGIAVILASARLSAKSVSRYMRFGKLFSAVFTDKVLIGAQSSVDAERFKSIGANAAQVHVLGNLKFDLELDSDSMVRGRELRSFYGAARPTWIAGSTHAGEEEQLLDAHTLLRADHPDALLLLVPRHKNRFQAVADLLSARGIKFVRRSEGITDPSAQVLLVDTIGELAVLYAAADVAFVGGSLAPIGGHNLLEPAALGVPVLTGPSHFNSKDIAALLLEQGAALEVEDSRELADQLRSLLDDPARRERMGAIGPQLIEANRGSVSRLLSLIEPYLAEHPSAAH
jgi:3-deoxy-D-manno-octulosonic-acid transferase